MATFYNLAELNRRVTQVRKEEIQIDDFFGAGEITEVTLKAGKKTITVQVNRYTGLAVAHELLLATIAKREKLEKKMSDPIRAVRSVEVEEGGEVV